MKVTLRNFVACTILLSFSLLPSPVLSTQFENERYDDHKHIKVQRGAPAVMPNRGLSNTKVNQSPSSPYRSPILQVTPAKRKLITPAPKVQVTPRNYKIGEVIIRASTTPSAAAALSSPSLPDGSDEMQNEYVGEEYDTNNGASFEKKMSELTLDEILNNPKAQQAIMEEVERRVLERMERVIDEVGEEIVEAMENDALAAMVEQKENKAYMLQPVCLNIIIFSVITSMIR